MEQRILKELIATYERSQGYKDQELKNRRVTIKPGRFRMLNFEDVEVKSAFIDALDYLKKESILDYTWVQFEEGNLVERMWLIQEEDAVEKAYRLLGLNPTYRTLENILKKLESCTFVIYPWVEDFKKHLRAQFEKRGKFGQLLSGDHEQQQRVIRALIELEERAGQPVHERVFSTEVYGDSKVFQKLVKGSLKTMLKRYLVDGEGAEDGDLLSYVGLYTNPELFHFCGRVQMEFVHGTADFRVFSKGATLPAVYCPEISKVWGEEITRVIFIENQATYEDYIRIMGNHELVVYHGGFANRRKQEFFAKLHHGLSDAKWYHWSDFDLGGIRIFKAIKSTIPSITPYLMNSIELEAYKERGMSFGEDYRRKVEDALEKETEPLIEDLYRDLLHFGVRMEQENVNF